MNSSTIKIIAIFALFCATLFALTIKVKLMQPSTDKKIKLFVYKTCPYCQKVEKYLKKINKYDQVTIMDVANNDNMKELLALTDNNSQCPYLFDEINNRKMHESDDIIKYFSTRF